MWSKAAWCLLLAPKISERWWLNEPLLPGRNFASTKFPMARRSAHPFVSLAPSRLPPGTVFPLPSHVLLRVTSITSMVLSKIAPMVRDYLFYVAPSVQRLKWKTVFELLRVFMRNSLPEGECSCKLRLLWRFFRHLIAFSYQHQVFPPLLAR